MSPSRRDLLILTVCLSFAGCGGNESVHLVLTPATTRAERRLYDGAPPVIPHPPLQINCVACHTDTGKETPPIGFAPANPHRQTAGIGATAHCQQCHVFRRDESLFTPSEFRGLTQTVSKAERLYAGAPPVIPHPVFMRENCLSCHSGPSARQEIRCSHPLRKNCRQCHVPGAPLPAELAFP